ncbi:MAG: hypothetical protein ACRBF0_24920 [Calditrichia bacterium]
MKKMNNLYSPVLVIVQLLIIATACSSEESTKREFDSTLWKSAAANPNSIIRLEMIEDFIKTHKSRDMSRQDIVDVLGLPKRLSYFSDYQMMYRLGNDDGLIPGPNYLVIRLDNNDRVEQLAIMKD